MDGAEVRWYAVGMTKKIAISLPDATLRKAKAAVEAGNAPNVSNYIAHLIEEASATETFEAMIAEWLEESGISPEELRAAEEESRAAFERAGLADPGTRGVQTARKTG